MAIQALESISAIQGITSAFESLKSVSNSATNLVQNGMTKVSGAISGVTGVAGRLTDTVSGKLGSAMSSVTGVVDSLQNSVGNKLGTAMNSVNGIMTTVTSTAHQLRESIGNKFGQALETMQPVLDIFGTSIGELPEKFGKFKEALNCTTEMKKLMKDVGINALQAGFTKLIGNWDGLSDTAQKFVQIGTKVAAVMTMIAKLSKGKLVASLGRGIAKLKAFTAAKFIAAKATITKKSALTLGAAVPAILAGIAAGTAGIAAVARSSGSRVSGGGVSGVISSANSSAISSKAVAKNNSQSLEQSVYNAYMAAIRDSGGNKSYVTVEMDSQVVASAIAEPLRDEYILSGVWNG